MRLDAKCRRIDATIDYQATEKVGFVIPNPCRLRVRDLLFPPKPGKQRILIPFKNRTGFGMTYF